MLPLSYLAGGLVRRCRRVARGLVLGVMIRGGLLRVRPQTEHGAPCWQGPPSEVVLIPGVKSNAAVPAWVSGMSGLRVIAGPYIEEVRDARLLEGIPFDGAGMLIGSAVIPENYRELSLHIPIRALAATLVRPRGKLLDSAVTLVNAWSDSYFHWVTEILPRVAVLMEAGINCPSPIVRGKMKPWQRESLAMLGVEAGRVVEAAGCILARRLLIPGFPRALAEDCEFSVPSPWSLEVMRKRICGSSACADGANVWISRRKAWGRRILNENEVLALLSDLKFQVAMLEDMTFSAQVELFRRARVVVGPHGAGLANIAFCRQGTRVVEVVGKFVNASFLTLAASLGLRYFLFQGKQVKRYPESRSDILLDASELARVIRDQVMDGDGT